jgi:DNA-binding HxlR family transcriptional regulator
MVLKIRKSKVQPAVPDCPMAACMAILGGAWTPEVVWHLSEGPRRFSELRRDLLMISAKVLTTRLRALEQQGVVKRAVMPTSPPSVEYDLTDLGLELVPAIRALVEVGHKLKQKARERAA